MKNPDKILIGMVFSIDNLTVSGGLTWNFLDITVLNYDGNILYENCHYINDKAVNSS